MAFDGFTTRAVISELNNVLIGAKVNKIFEPTKNEVILIIPPHPVNILNTLSD